MKIKLAEDTVQKDDVKALIGWLQQEPLPQLTMGELTKQFEEKAAKKIGRKYTVFCNSGSSANLLMFAALLESRKLRNNKVVVPAVSWATSSMPAIQLGFEPIMVGPEMDTFSLDLNNLESVCQKQDPSAVLCVEALGIPANIDELQFLSNKYGFELLMDDCAAVGSKYADGKYVGSAGVMSSFSLFWGHQVSTLEGGLVFTDNEHLYYLLLMMRSHGWLRGLPEEAQQKYVEYYQLNNFNKPFFFVVPGYNLRGTDLQAFLGLRQFDKLDQFAETRHKNHELYASLLSDKFPIQRWKTGERVSSISFGFLAHSQFQRERIVEKLNEAEIENRMYSAGNLGRHPFYYERFGEFRHALADQIHDCGLFVPNQQNLTSKDVEFVCSVIKSAS